MPVCTQGMQRTWWPEAGTIIVTGLYWGHIDALAFPSIDHKLGSSSNCGKYRDKLTIGSTEYPLFAVPWFVEQFVHISRQDWPGENTCDGLNLRALKISTLYENRIFQCKIFVWNVKDALWNSTQIILHIPWKIYSLLRCENLRALRFTSS